MAKHAQQPKHVAKPQPAPKTGAHAAAKKPASAKAPAKKTAPTASKTASGTPTPTTAKKPAPTKAAPKAVAAKATAPAKQPFALLAAPSAASKPSSTATPASKANAAPAASTPEASATPIAAKTAHPNTKVIAGIAAAIAAVAIAGIAYHFITSSAAASLADDEGNAGSSTTLQQTSIGSFEEASDVAAVAETVDFTAQPLMLDNIPASEGLQTFSLSSLNQPTLTSSQRNAITSAISEIEDNGGGVGFVLYNAETGRGIAYNLDEQIYGASSFKAPYALYICETILEQNANSAEEEGGFYGSFGYVVGTENLISAAILYSDNNSFESLRRMYDNSGYDEWVTALNIPDCAYTVESDFPWYSARSAAKLWTEMRNYVASGTETAQWLESLCGQTNVSFLRNALEGTGATVYNKAGWSTGYDWAHSYNGVCDAGIVKLDGETYVVGVMGDMTDAEVNRRMLENVIASIFDARTSLSLQVS